MGRLTAEGLMPMIAAKHFRPVVERFFSALRHAIPHLQPNEAMWRIHFMIGAMAHSMGCAPDVHKYLGGPDPAMDAPELVQQLIVFCAAGFRAPALSPNPLAPEAVQNIEVTE
jgi:hypothetical protein